MRHDGTLGSFFCWIAVAAGTVVALSDSAHACRMSVPAKLEDVSYSDVVVVGRVDDYRIIRDEAFRKQMLALPSLSENMRRIYEDPKGSLLSDYARFDVQVEEVIVGQAPSSLSVTWDNSTFGEPDHMAPGRYLIALRRPGSISPPLRGPSATILPAPDPNVLTLLQAPCSSAFIYGANSEEARTIREILSAQKNGLNQP